jgi:hypothetical protein
MPSLGTSGSDAREMLSGEAVVGGVALKGVTLKDASVGGPEKLDSEGMVPSSAIMLTDSAIIRDKIGEESVLKLLGSDSTRRKALVVVLLFGAAAGESRKRESALGRSTGRPCEGLRHGSLPQQESEVGEAKQ